MKKIVTLTFLLGFLLFGFTNTVMAQDESADKKEKKEKKKDPKKMRKEIQKMRKTALKELYALYPAAKQEVSSAAGYAVFGNTGMNLFVVSTGRGSGIAKNNRTGKDTYMKMFSGGVGVGIGVKKYYAIFIYLSEDALNSFLAEGWSSETQADAAAKSEDDGGAVAASVAVTPDIRLYQITDKGLAAQATIQGTKYSVDEELNNY